MKKIIISLCASVFFILAFAQNKGQQKKERIAWIDVIRIIACFLVVVSHSCDPFVGQFDNNYTEFLTGTLIGSFVRPCVPLFLMISGVLLLPNKLGMKEFYARRAKRLFLPFVFWAVAAPVFYYLYVNSGLEMVSHDLPAKSYTGMETFRKIYTFIFNFCYDTTPLWYMYMLTGLYLFLPIISAWLQQADKHDLKIFLILWTFSLCIPYLQLAAPFLGYYGNSGNMGLFGICNWNAYGTFYYFSGFIGYMVLAYYLKTFPLQWSMKRTLIFSVILFLVGYVITVGGYILTQKAVPGSYPDLEIIWNFSGINVAMMTVAVFILGQRIRFTPKAWIAEMADLTLGVYLCHFVFVQISYDFLYPGMGDTPAFLKIPAIAITTFVFSLLLVRLMSLHKLSRKVVV